ncbi:MAG: hypothetical protein U1F57_06085 [bacterium]
MRKRGIILFYVCFSFFSTSVFAQPKEIRGIAHWHDGKGDCGANRGVGYAGNGTGYIADFRINSYYVIDQQNLAFHFVGYNGKEFFGPLTGALNSQNNFDLKSRQDKYDEDYRFQGKLAPDSASGTFTRMAHYIGAGNGGPRCTATWTVDFKAGPWANAAPGASTRPSTVSPP